jgi:hypothetical protein
VRELVIGTVGVVWMVTPLVLTAAAWRKWDKAERPRDFPFIIGVSLGTLGCFEIIPFLLPNTTRWEQLRVDIISYGALVAGVCILAALLVLPFATFKAKWLAFTSSAMTLVFIAMFLFSLSA